MFLKTKNVCSVACHEILQCDRRWNLAGTFLVGSDWRIIRTVNAIRQGRQTGDIPADYVHSNQKKELTYKGL